MAELDHANDGDLSVSRRPSPSNQRVLLGLAVALWTAMVGLTRAWGMHLEATGTRLILFTPPVVGGYREVVSPRLWIVAGAGALLAWGLPWVAERVSWAALLAVTTAGAAVWWLALGSVDGWDGLTRGLYWEADYADAVEVVAGAPGRFLRDYVATLPEQPIALRGHPPGFALLFGFLEWIGLTGDGWAAAVVVATGLSAVAAVLVTMRCVAGEPVARRAAPFVALTPAATWIVTSTDAVTMATGAWLVALLALAGTTYPARRRPADLYAVAAGVLAAFTVLQSYGAVLLTLPVAAIAWHQRRWRPMIVAALVAVGIVVTLAGWGFWWFEGLFATMHEYQSLGVERPYEFALFANLGAWALALGPATAAGLAALRHRPTWVVVGGGLSAALVADLSGLSELEVERIWLPFTLLVLPAAGCLWASRRVITGWLMTQVVSAVAFTAVIGANW